MTERDRPCTWCGTARCYNPTKVLYGRLPGFRLSDRGLAQAEAAADFLAGRDIVAVIASPLERAQETAAPIAAGARPRRSTSTRG